MTTRTPAQRMAAIEAAIERLETAIKDHAEQSEKGMASLKAELVSLLGYESDDAKGGQGLRGEIARIRARQSAHERIGWTVAGAVSVLATFRDQIIAVFTGAGS